MVPGEKYHLFNHANGRENIFTEQKNYDFFLKKLAHHILPVCKLFSYCMMPNHFHLVLQIRSEEELRTLWKKSTDLTPLSQKQLELKISKSFANLFSSYTQAYNKVYKRMGSMFIPSMKMKSIGGEDDLCKVIHYSHANPVHHGFTRKMEDWHYSSYKIMLGKNPTNLERDLVLEIFGGLDAYIKYHERPIELKNNFPE
jgi:putative transposase